MTSPVVEPGAVVQLADYPAGAWFGPRLLVDYEFVWVLSGSATWTVHDRDPANRLVGGESQVLRPGTLALAHAGTVDSYHWDEERVSTHAYVHFRITDFGGLGPPPRWPATRTLVASPVLDGLCSYLLELAGQDSTAARLRGDQLLALLLDLFVTGPLEEPPQLPHPYVAATVECARRAWAVDGPRVMAAAELASAANVSSGHLFRVFRTELGCGPARALELVRLARSAVGLQRSNASIAEVAHRGGFANAYHFSRRFSHAYGMPPGAFRALGIGPDPLEPIRRAGLVAFATPLMSSSVG